MSRHLRAVLAYVISPYKRKSKIGAAIFLFLLGYLIRKCRQKKVKYIFIPTELNKEIKKILEPIAKRYSPSIHLPTALLMIARGDLYLQRHKNVRFQREPVSLSHSARMSVEWYPPNALDLPETTPVVAHFLGVTGNSKSPYVFELALRVAAAGHRLAIIHRIGFGNQTLETARFISKMEHVDFHEVLTNIKIILPKARLYLIGVSAGANNVCRYLGNFPENQVTAAVSISNPFNVARISFAERHNQLSKFFSKYIAKALAQSYQSHIANPNFQSLISEHFTEAQAIRNLIETKGLTCWKLDKALSHKLGGHESIYDYYINISSEHVIGNIKTPLLVINCNEDPICLKEIIPIEKLGSNPAIFSMMFDRGGHIEYFSGWNEERLAYTLALKYIEFFEKSAGRE